METTCERLDKAGHLAKDFKFKCLYCNKAITGTKTKLVDHFLGNGTLGCMACPLDLLAKVKSERKKRDTVASARKRNRENAQEEEAQRRRAEIRKLADDLANREGDNSVNVNHSWKQSTLEECEGAAQLDFAQQAVARMWFATAMSFNNLVYAEVVDAFDAVCAYGAETGNTTFKLPYIKDLRNHRLDREVKRIEAELMKHKKSMETFGMSLQSDGKDNLARRHLVNIVTTTPLGAEFRKVVDVSGCSRPAYKFLRLLDTHSPTLHNGASP